MLPIVKKISSTYDLGSSYTEVFKRSDVTTSFELTASFSDFEGRPIEISVSQTSYYTVNKGIYLFSSTNVGNGCTCINHLQYLCNRCLRFLSVGCNNEMKRVRMLE